MQWCASVSSPAATKALSAREKRIEKLASEVFLKGVQFMKSAPGLDFLPSHRQSYPEVCLCGPVNSGKSSLIQAITGNERMARAGSKKGNTETIRFFCVGDAFMIADSVGYGVWEKSAMFSRSKRLCGHALARQYLSSRRNLQMAYFVVDSSKKPSCLTTRDKEFYAWLRAERIPTTVVASKADKVDAAYLRAMHTAVTAELHAIEQSLGLGENSADQLPFLETSAKTGRGIHRLMVDMVYNAANELEDDSLSMFDLQRLSYTPLSVAERVEVESKFVPEAHNLPISDNVPYPAWITQPGTPPPQLEGGQQKPSDSFYFSLEKPLERLESGTKPVGTKAVVEKEKGDLQSTLQKAIDGVYARSDPAIFEERVHHLPTPDVTNYLSRCPGTLDKFLLDNLASYDTAIEEKMVGSSEFFEEKVRQTKRQRRMLFYRRDVLREHIKPSKFVSARLHYPFMRDEETTQGGSRMVAGLKQSDDQNTFGPATLQKDRRRKHLT